jgi:hypothetical protein
VVSLSGAFQAWRSLRITHSLEEAKRTQAFSKQILDQMDNLTGDNETKDKMNIANIAAERQEQPQGCRSLSAQAGMQGIA